MATNSRRRTGGGIKGSHQLVRVSLNLGMMNATAVIQKPDRHMEDYFYSTILGELYGIPVVCILCCISIILTVMRAVYNWRVGRQETSLLFKPSKGYHSPRRQSRIGQSARILESIV